MAKKIFKKKFKGNGKRKSKVYRKKTFRKQRKLNQGFVKRVRAVISRDELVKNISSFTYYTTAGGLSAANSSTGFDLVA